MSKVINLKAEKINKAIDLLQKPAAEVCTNYGLDTCLFTLNYLFAKGLEKSNRSIIWKQEILDEARKTLDQIKLK